MKDASFPDPKLIVAFVPSKTKTHRDRRADVKNQTVTIAL
jgi:hypothetical protein